MPPPCSMQVHALEAQLAMAKSFTEEMRTQVCKLLVWMVLQVLCVSASLPFPWSSCCTSMMHVLDAHAHQALSLSTLPKHPRQVAELLEHNQLLDEEVEELQREVFVLRRKVGLWLLVCAV